MSEIVTNDFHVIILVPQGQYRCIDVSL